MAKYKKVPDTAEQRKFRLEMEADAEMPNKN